MIEVAAALPGLVWALPIIGLARLGRGELDLAGVPPAHGVPVSIIIPARNETETIETVIASVLASTYDALELIVVDDCSTDDTAAKVAALAARDSRVRLLRGVPLPEGWRGKPWACSQGAAIATGHFLLFIDADTRHTPPLVSHAVGAMTRERIDMLSLLPTQRCITFWERVIQPQVLVVLAVRYTPARVNRATRPDQVCANGQFIMFRRDTYDAIGGHGAVRGDIVEDMALAQTIIRSGLRLRLMFAQSLLETRMYRSLDQLVEGWSKNLYLGSRMSAPKVPFARALAPFLFMLTLIFWLVPLGVLATGTHTAAAITAIASSLVFWALASRGMEIPAWYGLVYPLGAVMALGITIKSAWRGARHVVWRGRSYGA